MATEQQVQVAHQMYEMRRTLKRLCPDFLQRLEPYNQILRAVMKKDSIGEIAAALVICKQLENEDGVTRLWVISAAVEMIEPSEVN